MSIRHTLAGVLLAVGLLAAPQASAQGLKVGYTEADIIVAQMPEYRDMVQELQGFVEAGQQEYQGLVESYQEKLADYQQKQALLSEQARATREEELVELQGQIQQFAAAKEQEVAQKEAELLGPLLDRVQTAINEVAAEQGLQLVLNSRAAGQPMILFASDEMNITEAVMSKLGITPATGESSSR
ncbi:MAG: OmpH family outer membrane protein [Bacteroidota bacterium]